MSVATETSVTITEALQEVKTIQARIDKKREAIMRYFYRDGRLKDPLQDSGGSVEYVRRERQSVADLEERVVRIRTAIQRANQECSLTVNGVTRTVAEWLNWRRDVAPKNKAFLTQMATALNGLRAQAPRQGQTVSDKDTGAPGEVVVSVKEQELAADVEAMEATLGSLDGKLSLANATVRVSF